MFIASLIPLNPSGHVKPLKPLSLKGHVKIKRPLNTSCHAVVIGTCTIT